MKVTITYEVTPEDYHFKDCNVNNYDAQTYVLNQVVVDVENELKPFTNAEITVVDGKSTMTKTAFGNKH